ncbi:MAG: hypothetical protein QGH94_16400, partial [Phycisphaerae bacterium]|nr:hypothetical protein [Phycisphaerae bacterium]
QLEPCGSKDWPSVSRYTLYALARLGTGWPDGRRGVCRASMRGITNAQTYQKTANSTETPRQTQASPQRIGAKEFVAKPRRAC